MVKFVAQIKDNFRLIGLGLSARNCEKLLLENRPIEIDLRKDLNLPFRLKILIFGESEKAMYEQFKAAGFIHKDYDPPRPPGRGRTSEGR